MNINTYFYAMGRRKTASAKVFLAPGNGDIKIICKDNGNKIEKELKDYFKNNFYLNEILKPFSATSTLNKFDVKTSVRGGGYSGQIGAIQLAIARALVKYDESLKSLLKKQNLMKCDPRLKERKKFGKYGARRSPQFTKR